MNRKGGQYTNNDKYLNIFIFTFLLTLASCCFNHVKNKKQAAIKHLFKKYGKF